MANRTSLPLKMRIIHRYLGFFLAGIMSVYALSGIVLIYRDTDVFKNKTTVNLSIKPNLDKDQLIKVLDIKKMRILNTENGVIYFNNDGQYTVTTGEVTYVKKELPYLLDKLTHFHKAETSDPLYFLNMFFGASLLFFAISSFWMFMPSTTVFKKGMLFVAGGILLALAMLFI